MTQDTKETNLHHLQSYIKVRHSKGKDLIAVFEDFFFPIIFLSSEQISTNFSKQPDMLCLIAVSPS